VEKTPVYSTPKPAKKRKPIPPENKKRLHKKANNISVSWQTSTVTITPTQTPTPSKLYDPLAEAADKNTKLSRIVRDLNKLKDSYLEQIADQKSTVSQLKRNVYNKDIIIADMLKETEIESIRALLKTIKEKAQPVAEIQLEVEGKMIESRL